MNTGDIASLQEISLYLNIDWSFPLYVQPGLWQPPRVDQEVWAYVLQTMFPQQCQGDWFHQGELLLHPT